MTRSSHESQITLHDVCGDNSDRHHRRQHRHRQEKQRNQAVANGNGDTDATVGKAERCRLEGNLTCQHAPQLKPGDCYGRKPLITAGMFLCAISFAAIPLLINFYLLGLGAAMGTFGTIFDIGHAAGPILAGFLIVRLDYLLTFWIMATMLLAAIPVFMATVKIKQAPV